MNLTLAQIDEALAKEKWPAISPWWQRVFDRVEEIKPRNVVVRGGRRGGKSSNLCGKVAIREVLSEDHEVPPGDVGYFAIISADKEQAQDRLDTCHKALSALGIAHRKTANEITLTDRNVGIKCFAATLQAVVSFTCIGFLADEMARWRDKDTGDNPAKQIVTSLRATMATMPNARGWYVSAPWSTLDYHHEMVEQGDSKAQLVFHGATWEMNPTLTEEMTHDLEPDYASWQREYAAVPMASDETKFFAAEFIDAAVNNKIEFVPDRFAAGSDFAFRRNSSALSVLSVSGEEKSLRFKLLCDEERIPGKKALVPSETIEEFARIAANHGCESIACDLHYIETVREVTDDMSLELVEFPTSNEGIAKAYIRLRVLLSRGQANLSMASPTLIAQLKETTVQPTQTGMTIKNKTVGSAHGDRVSGLVCAVFSSERSSQRRGGAAVGSRRYANDRNAVHEAPQLSDYAPHDD